MTVMSIFLCARCSALCLGIQILTIGDFNSFGVLGDTLYNWEQSFNGESKTNTGLKFYVLYAGELASNFRWSLVYVKWLLNNGF